MSLNAKDITERWEQIRQREECDLSLAPDKVAKYLSIPESELVKARIIESLIQFADYRLETNGFTSTKPDKPGEMATCEGLEAFFIPAVESALRFSEFLEHYEAKGGDRKAFVEVINRDIEGLLDGWEKGLFSGEPYANIKKLQAGIDPGLKDQFKQINITESASLACRVLMHLLTLKLNRTNEELFQKEIGDTFSVARLFTALSEAIGFLVRAFQKGEGATEEEQIANAKVGTQTGSGWSWTDRPGLPPMLFFTAAAVDAFAEIDLYLIRPALNRDWVGSAGLDLANFHRDNVEKLQHFELCVDMARRWVQKAVLLYLIDGYGQYAEKFPQGKDQWEYLEFNEKPGGYDHYKEDLERWRELQHPPMVLYNSLYALLIMLWSWGDQNDSGKAEDDEAKNQINRAISQLVYNYSIPVVKEILNRFEYVFYLPGTGIFKPGGEKKDREYLDSAFLPLLTRLLVLFVVYGVGDRNMLEPIIRNLYVELLQSRHRNKIEYSALWSNKEIEIFSTQRSVQALTFYYAYAGGKEIVEEKSGGGDLVLRNKTGQPLVLEAFFDRPVRAMPQAAPAEPESVEVAGDPDGFDAENFHDYCKKRDAKWHIADVVDDGEAYRLQNAAKKLGEEILSDYKEGRTRNVGAIRLILNSIMNITAAPESKDGVRYAELTLLRKQYNDLTGQSSDANGNS